MNQRPEQHINHDQLLKALVDRADLSAAQQAHLGQCPVCRHALQRLEQRFTRLGEIAKHLAPEPSRSFRLPAGKASPAGWRFKPMWAAGLVAAMLLVFTMWWPHRLPVSQLPQMTAQSLEADRQLMEEIEALVENALPASLKQVAAVSEPVVDEDLLDWIIPSINGEVDDSLT